ncbi:hypothetical protein [Cerasicoccus fimbriatus]|uniref:hypothetical protein n=1 Tax=Cerasicoccus fimbriatus TaxID=3014554 RepID=UPI0022B4043E|nr:hypothetical protein [Cerasicoccus sp. TK19100]
MRKYFIPAIIASSLFLAACGDSKDEKPFIELPADNKPANQSGSVQVTERTYKIELEAPTAGYSIKIDSVWVVGEEIWVISKLTVPEGMAAQVITPISDEVKLTLPDISPEYYVIGKKIGPDMEGVTFIDSQADIQAKLDIGEQVWPKQ